MKRLVVIPVMVLYLLAVSGIMFHLHYCGKQLESWNIFAKNSGCESDCGDESRPEHNCCKDKVVTAKISEDQQASFFKIQFAQEYVFTPAIVFPVAENVSYHSCDKISYRANAPPGLWQNRALYKLHSRLTYYG